MKQKQCKAEGCELLFTPRNMQHKTCGYECAKAYAKAVIKKRKEKVARRDLKEFNQNDRQFLTKAAQKVVNQYVRLRDRNEPCISCKAPAGFRIEAGHYRSAGGNGAIRFNTLNIHAQDHRCNCHMSANLVPYRENLIEKIGLEKVLWLEAQRQPRRYSVEYLQKLIRVFKKKIKLMESRV